MDSDPDPDCVGRDDREHDGGRGVEGDADAEDQELTTVGANTTTADGRCAAWRTCRNEAPGPAFVTPARSPRGTRTGGRAIAVGREENTTASHRPDHRGRRDHGQDHPLADLALDRFTVPGLGEHAEPLAHDLKQAPPGTADDEAADAQIMTVKAASPPRLVRMIRNSATWMAKGDLSTRSAKRSR